MKIALNASVAAIALCSNFAIAQSQPAVQDLDNKDLEWVVSTFGLGTELSPRAQKSLGRIKEEDVDALVDMLSDAKRFAIAHEILVRLLKPDSKQDDSTYYGLTVIVRNGVASYPSYDAGKSIALWKRIRKERMSQISMLIKELQESSKSRD